MSLNIQGCPGGVSLGESISEELWSLFFFMRILSWVGIRWYGSGCPRRRSLGGGWGGGLAMERLLAGSDTLEHSVPELAQGLGPWMGRP